MIAHEVLCASNSCCGRLRTTLSVDSLVFLLSFCSSSSSSSSSLSFSLSLPPPLSLKQQPATEAECCSACVANPNCRAVTLYNDRCYLKTNFSSVRTTPGAQSLVVRAGPLQQGGRYGHWRTDEAGWPAYVYELDQTQDGPQRVGHWSGVPVPLDTTSRNRLEHPFQLVGWQAS